MSGRSPIEFPGHAQWVAVSQDGARSWASRSDVSPLAVRVLFAAISRQDSTGHAPFKPRELRELLGEVGPDYRRMPARSDTTSRAIREAKLLGFICEESTAECLVLSDAVFQRGNGRRVPCAHDR